MTDVTTASTSPPYTLGPPKTIWGLSVEDFSYLFLAIGGIAPILFFIITAVGMKCYSQRHSSRRVGEEYMTSQHQWELQRARTHDRNHGHTNGQQATSMTPASQELSRDSQTTNTTPYMLNIDNLHHLTPTMLPQPDWIPPSETESELPSLTSYPHVISRMGPPNQSRPPNMTASLTNPNVYFSSTSSRAGESTTDSSQGLTQVTELSHNSSNGLPAPPALTGLFISPEAETPADEETIYILGPEEASALAAFDKIYEDDVVMTRTNTDLPSTPDIPFPVGQSQHGDHSTPTDLSALSDPQAPRASSVPCDKFATNDPASLATSDLTLDSFPLSSPSSSSTYIASGLVTRINIVSDTSLATSLSPHHSLQHHEEPSEESIVTVSSGSSPVYIPHSANMSQNTATTSFSVSSSNDDSIDRVTRRTTYANAAFAPDI